jgi:hypothetical protein
MKRQPPPPASAIPTALTIHRVGDTLTTHGFTFRMDDDGDLTGLWEGHPFWFMLRGDGGEVLHILGRWSEPLARPARLALLQAVNDWNRDQLLPKASIRTEGDALVLYADHAVILQGGVTDEQLSTTIMGTLTTTLGLFNALTSQIST